MHQVTRQFLHFDPLVVPWSTSDADKRAFYLAYAEALTTASTDSLIDAPFAWRWYRDLLANARACAEQFSATGDTAAMKRAS